MKQTMEIIVCSKCTQTKIIIQSVAFLFIIDIMWEKASKDKIR